MHDAVARMAEVGGPEIPIVGEKRGLRQSLQDWHQVGIGCAFDGEMFRDGTGRDAPAPELFFRRAGNVLIQQEDDLSHVRVAKRLGDCRNGLGFHQDVPRQMQRLLNGFVCHRASPRCADFVPRFAPLDGTQYLPDHYPRPLEGGLAVADIRICHDVFTKLDGLFHAREG